MDAGVPGGAQHPQRAVPGGRDHSVFVYINLVGELSIASPHFRGLWARHDVGPRRGASLTIDHPQVGPVRLDREKLSITGTDGAMLVIYHPEPGTDSAEKLALIGVTTAGTTPRADVGLERIHGERAGQ